MAATPAEKMATGPGRNEEHSTLKGCESITEMRKSLDRRACVRHYCITVKTATVRDLRNHFADVAKWIEDGEKVAITRNGAAFATLAPASMPKPCKADWKSRAAMRKPLGRQLSVKETEAFWSRLRD